MDAMPEPYYYLPLPRPPRLRIARVSFTLSRVRRTWDGGRGMGEKLAAHTPEVALWILVAVLAVAVGALVAHV
jgi:hypothetical protein